MRGWFPLRNKNWTYQNDPIVRIATKYANNSPEIVNKINTLVITHIEKYSTDFFMITYENSKELPEVHTWIMSL